MVKCLKNLLISCVYSVKIHEQRMGWWNTYLRFEKKRMIVKIKIYQKISNRTLKDLKVTVLIIVPF